MLMTNLDPGVADRPGDLVVYGGTGKAARDWPPSTPSCARSSHSRTTKPCWCNPAVPWVSSAATRRSPAPSSPVPARFL